MFDHARVKTLFAVGLLLLSGLGCSMLRPKQPLTWQIILEVDEAVPDPEAAAKQDIRVIEARLNAIGVSNFEMQSQGNGRILLRLPNVKDPERLKRFITYWGKLDLVHVVSPSSPAPAQTYPTREEAINSLGSGGTIPSTRRVLPYSERAELAGIPGVATGATKQTKWVVVESPAIIDGSELRNATAVPTRTGASEYEIQFTLKKAGADKFGEWTGKNINEYIGVILNDEVKSIAYIKSQIFDTGVISGRYSKESAEDLALALRSGALPARLKIVEESTNK